MTDKLKLIPDTHNAVNTIIFNHYCDKDAIVDLACSLMVKILQESLSDKSKTMDLICLYPTMISLVDNLSVQDVICIIKTTPNTICYIEENDMRLEYIKSFLDFGYDVDHDYVLLDMDNVIFESILDEETALRLAVIDSTILDSCKSKIWYDDVIRLANLELT